MGSTGLEGAVLDLGGERVGPVMGHHELKTRQHAEDGDLHRMRRFRARSVTNSLAEWMAQFVFPNFRFTTKTVFPKSLKLMNSGLGPPVERLE